MSPAPANFHELARRILERATADCESPAQVAHTIESTFARLTELPWGIASSEDLRLPSSPGSPSALQALTGRWSREVARLAAHGDARAQRSMSSLYHLMVSPRVLLDPRLVATAVRSRISGSGRPNPRPQIVAPVSQATPAGPPRALAERHTLKA